MNPVELKFANAFNAVPNVGPATLRALKKHFGNFSEAWRADQGSLAQAELDKTALQSIVWKKNSLHPDREIEKLFKENIWLIDEENEIFPNLLKEIPSPPFLIYGRGNPSLLTKLGCPKNPEPTLISVAIVGTRKPTAYGREAAAKLAAELVLSRIVVTSGLALGIDTCAHENVLENKGDTIAVLGSGLNGDSIFPQENRGLARRIADTGGIVLSEYAPYTPAVKEHFPQRNRIISGLSKGVLVIEARERSGALITSRLALEQNREVFALPGSIFALPSAGPNQLIKQGAKLVTSAQDILEDLGVSYSQNTPQINKEMLDEKEWTILQLLEEPLTLDRLKETTELPTPALLSSLSMLELRGLVKNLGGDTYQKI